MVIGKVGFGLTFNNFNLYISLYWFKLLYSWLLNNLGIRDANQLSSSKFDYNFSQPSTCMVPPPSEVALHPRVCVLSSTKLESCNTIVFTIEKKIHVQVDPHSSNPCCSMSIVVRIFQKVFLQHWFPWEEELGDWGTWIQRNYSQSTPS